MQRHKFLFTNSLDLALTRKCKYPKGVYIHIRRHHQSINMRSARGQPAWLLFVFLPKTNERCSVTTGQPTSDHTDSINSFLSFLLHLMCRVSERKHRDSAYWEGPHEGLQSTRWFLTCFQRQRHAGWNVWCLKLHPNESSYHTFKCMHGLDAWFCLCIAKFVLYKTLKSSQCHRARMRKIITCLLDITIRRKKGHTMGTKRELNPNLQLGQHS